MTPPRHAASALRESSFLFHEDIPMSLFRNSSRPARGRVIPRIETLEDRCVPATFTFNGATGTLTVTGSNHRDAIAVQDDGTNNAGAVVVSDNGTILFSSGPTAGVDQVHTIIINTLGGKDRVSYDLTGDMVANNRSLQVKFGNGKGDRFDANLDGNLVNSFLLLQVQGGGGGTRFTNNVNGSLNGASFLGLIEKGGHGKHTITVDATNTVNIDPIAQMTVDLVGGAGNATIGVNYEGQLQGALFFDALGGAGNDHVSARLVFEGVSNGLLFGPTSPNTGKAAATVEGGGGNDRLSFEVDLSGVLKAASAAEINGGPGFDICHAAGFITGVFNCKKTV
jgi:hypothetical protein